MKIAIEASSMYGNRSGVGRYALEISKQLANQRPNDTFTLFNFLRPGRKLLRDFSFPPNTSYQHIRWFPGRGFSLLMRHGIALPMELFRLFRADITLFPVFVSWASLFGQKRICVIHDLAYMLYPEHIQAKNLAYMKAQVGKSIKRSSLVVAVSESTKKDIIRFFNTPASKIRVVPNGVDLSFFKPASVSAIKEVRKKYSLPDAFILFLGNVEPRKNIAGLLKAYASSYREHKLPLVVGGGRGWNDADMQQQFSELSHLPIQRLGYVDEEHMPALYSAATMFVFPSEYEGFGIPVLEAMACGCPVICSDNSSFPEVVADAALMVPSKEPQLLATTINKLFQDRELRGSMIEKGKKQAQNYTWEKAGSSMSAILDEVGQKSDIKKAAV